MEIIKLGKSIPTTPMIGTCSTCGCRVKVGRGEAYDVMDFDGPASKNTGPIGKIDCPQENCGAAIIVQDETKQSQEILTAFYGD